MAKRKYTVDVACFYCFTPNRVRVGVGFYNATAWYECHKCGKSSQVEITQTPLDKKASTIQTGEKI